MISWIFALFPYHCKQFSLLYFYICRRTLWCSNCTQLTRKNFASVKKKWRKRKQFTRRRKWTRKTREVHDSKRTEKKSSVCSVEPRKESKGPKRKYPSSELWKERQKSCWSKHRKRKKEDLLTPELLVSLFSDPFWSLNNQSILQTFV